MSEPNVLAAALSRAEREPQWLADACGLSPETIARLLPYYLPLARGIVELHAARRAPICIGIQGPQGAGKTTLVHLLQRVLTDTAALRVACLSIDDIYLTRAERAELAARVHPLFMTRGVPGTHDVELGVRVLRALTQPGAVAIPRFDKSRDDRIPENAWPVVQGPCDVVLFEGLWIGLPAMDEATLDAPVNALEATEDAQAVWRRHANRELRQHYAALSAQCQWLIHFRVPNFDCVKKWRGGAEHALRAKLQAQGTDTSRVMDDAALARFFDHYERFTAHAMNAMPTVADVVLTLDAEHRVVESSLR